MMKSLFKNDPLMKIVGGSFVHLPSPSNISYFWNFGSLLGLCLGMQILTGLFLSMHYGGDTSIAFLSVSHIVRDVNYGWMFRILHANGASLFFMALYAHIGRGIYFKSYLLFHTWMIGVTILFLTMATAFMGYVLPWGQMSFWGATVITNLASAIPYFGTSVVTWLWGGFAVDNATLSRFYSLHFLFPFVITAMVMTHLFFLHQPGSSNPLGTSSNYDKVPFHPYFSFKDLLGAMLLLSVFSVICFFYPWDLGDPENFLGANVLVTPVHIQPEWYFLFAYAILRSIPNKLGGVLALVFSVAILWALGFFPQSTFKSTSFYPSTKSLFWSFGAIVILLTWIGARPVEEPFILTGQILTVLYFFYFVLLILMTKLEDSALH